ncbi:MAG TPA: cation diffusion facilitator family transporter [Longimicrobiales bacterium]|nr:cation diffusion facilitator family transporter [Longimicrobiales bacterium]
MTVHARDHNGHREAQQLRQGRSDEHEHGHRHDHVHDHGHEHDHSHDLRELGRRRLSIVLAITAAFMVVELVGGILANSLALVADAAHMLSDVASLALAIFALWFSRRPATARRSFGYLRIEILAALINGATLIALSLLIYWQAWSRLRVPQEVEGGLMLAVASGGLLVNIVGALLLHGASGHSLNVRGAYLHVLGDLLGSVGAIAAALVILFTGWMPADPIISALVATLILYSSFRLVRESVDVLLEATPSHIDLADVQARIESISGVERVYDLHVWTLTSGFVAMSGHVVITDAATHRTVLDAIHQRMHDDYDINHVTVQIEPVRLYRIEG